METKMINLPKTLDWHFIKSVDDLPKVRKRCLLHVRKYWGSHEEYIDVGELSGIGLTKEQRNSMKECERKHRIENIDQDGNNLVNWMWNGNKCDLEGQDVVAWAYI